MRKSMIIIGAGIAGLATGCYARMNGYEPVIFEMHDKPGGLCTSWKRKGYVIDGSISWLIGIVPGTDFYPFWEELGVIKGREFFHTEEYNRIYGKDGRTFIGYGDADRLEKHMKELSPADSKAIEEFTGLIRLFSKMRMPVGKSQELMSPIEKAKMVISMLPYMSAFSKYSKVTVKDYAQKFSDPLIREGLKNLFYLDGFPLMSLIFTMGGFHAKTQGYPLGGSLALSKDVEKRYIDLGGQVQYRSKVENIIVENDRAVGVRLSDGTEHRADIVVWAADAHAAIFDLLEGKYVDERIKSYFEKNTVFPPFIQVSFGVTKDFTPEPHMQSFLLDAPVTIAGRKNDRLTVKHCCHDKSMAPAGKSVLMVTFQTDYGYWKGFSREMPEYQAEKDRIAATTTAALEKIYPGISDNIEVVDVATPLTYVRYTGNWQGSFMGWYSDYSKREALGKTLPGLKDFYMAGMWTFTNGGVPTGAATGKWVVQGICKEDNKQFTTTKA